MKTECRTEPPPSRRGNPGTGLIHGIEKTLRIPVGREFITGDWVMPEAPEGIVLFAHGSGSSRHSSRNKVVARFLQERGIGTLLMDLLTPEEERIDSVTAHLRFDIPLLATRLGESTRWLQSQTSGSRLPIGYFGASTGAGAALLAAAERPGEIAAIVSRGGRPDLAGRALPHVTSPTLLIVGGNDRQVEELNRGALAPLRCPKEIVIVPGATHLFEEPGCMDRVSELAADWFLRHFKAGHSPEPAKGEKP